MAPTSSIRNIGDGTFENISDRAGIGRSGWSTSGAFLDYDRDGDLDLYVARYGYWKLPDDDRYCEGTPLPMMKNPPKARIYCSPKSIAPARHVLYRNNGDRIFTDVTDGRGTGAVRRPGTGRGRHGLERRRLDRSLRRQRYVPQFRVPQPWRRHVSRRHGIVGSGLRPRRSCPRGHGRRRRGRQRRRPARPVRHQFWNEPNSLFINLGNGRFTEQYAEPAA